VSAAHGTTPRGPRAFGRGHPIPDQQRIRTPKQHYPGTRPVDRRGERLGAGRSDRADLHPQPLPELLPSTLGNTGRGSYPVAHQPATPGAAPTLSPINIDVQATAATTYTNLTPDSMEMPIVTRSLPKEEKDFLARRRAAQPAPGPQFTIDLSNSTGTPQTGPLRLFPDPPLRPVPAAPGVRSHVVASASRIMTIISILAATHLVFLC
jgi:hypothetical protein